jgi:hypothetical protein
MSPCFSPKSAAGNSVGVLLNIDPDESGGFGIPRNTRDKRLSVYVRVSPIGRGAVDRLRRAQMARVPRPGYPPRQQRNQAASPQPRSTSGAPSRVGVTIRRHCITNDPDLQQRHKNGSTQWWFLIRWIDASPDLHYCAEAGECAQVITN